MFFVASFGATLPVFPAWDEEGGFLKEAGLKKRIKNGKVNRQDVTRRLAELAFGEANDCVRLILEQAPELDKLDLSLLSEIKRSEKGSMEIKLIDRLQALEQLARAASEEPDGLEDFLNALGRAGEAEP